MFQNRNMGHPCLWWGKVTKSNRGSFDSLRSLRMTDRKMKPRRFGFVLPHPSKARMGHPCLWWVKYAKSN